MKAPEIYGWRQGLVNFEKWNPKHAERRGRESERELVFRFAFPPVVTQREVHILGCLRIIWILDLVIICRRPQFSLTVVSK